MIVIEKGIPAPPQSIRRRDLPFATMEIGESFVAPADMAPSYAAQLAGIANRQHRPKKFAGRLTPEGRRIWRVT